MRQKNYTTDPTSNYLTLKQASQFFNVSCSTIQKIGKASQAKVKIGSCARYQRDRLEQYFEANRETGG